MGNENQGAVAPTVTQAQLDAVLAELAVLKKTVKQVPASTMQTLVLPTGKSTAMCHFYTEYYPVYRLINPANPSGGFILQTTGQYAGRPKSFGFKKQNRKEIVITWANGAEVRFMKTQDSPKIHDSRTPTMTYTQDHVVAELKRVMGDDVKAIKGGKWLMDVVVYDKVTKNPKTLYGKSKTAGFLTYGKVYGKKAKQPRDTQTVVTPSVPLNEPTAAVEEVIPF